MKLTSKKLEQMIMEALKEAAKDNPGQNWEETKEVIRSMMADDSTTAEDALLRNKLYHSIGPKETRRVLATLFPKGSVASIIEKRMSELREERGLIEEENKVSLVTQLYEQILDEYKKNPDCKRLPV